MSRSAHLALAFLLLSYCSYTQALDASAQPTDRMATPNARAVQAYLAALTNNQTEGVIAGQNTGHSDDINNSSGLSGFAPLVVELEKQTGEAPGIIGVDYEHNKIATPEQLSLVNKRLIAWWQSGGLVAINWSPQNPWWNDESDIANKPGFWTFTRTSGGDMSKVNLSLLTNPQSPIYPIWRHKLERVANALQELQDAGVVVLWRPMQEMNGNWFWWGNSAEPKNAESYIILWQDMYKYFTQTKGLHNLLWVYSPNQGPSLLEHFAIKPVEWRYPGNEFVDVVAGTSYNNDLNIKDYETYKRFGKPIAMAEFGPLAGSPVSRAGKLDTQLYAKRFQQDYPAMAYWMSWSSWSNGDGTQENQALIHNQNAKLLLTNPAVITRSHIRWKEYLSEPKP